MPTKSLIAEIESFLAAGGEQAAVIPQVGAFTDDKGRLWVDGKPITGSFTLSDMRLAYGDAWADDFKEQFNAFTGAQIDEDDEDSDAN